MKRSRGSSPPTLRPCSYLTEALKLEKATRVAPVERADLRLCPSSTVSALSLRVSAPRAPTSADLAVARFPKYVELKHPILFDIVPHDSYPVDDVADAAAFTSTVVQHLHMSSIFSSGPASLPRQARAAVFVPKSSISTTVRVAIAAPSDAAPRTFSLQALTLAGHAVTMPVSAPVRLGINHAPAKGGRLWEAASAGDAAGVVSALAAGSSTEETKRGKPALFVAVTGGHAEVVRVLLAAGADPINGEGFMPYLHLTHNVDVIDALLEDPRVDINACNGNGYTALHLTAMFCGAPELRRLLADPRLDPNVITKHGSTALAEAERRFASVGYCDRSAAEVLDALRADPRVTKLPRVGSGAGRGGGALARR